MPEVTVDEYGRPEPPREGGEVATLHGFLDDQRATLEWKCRGYARHNGHADLMRESIDGQTGE